MYPADERLASDDVSVSVSNGLEERSDVLVLDGISDLCGDLLVPQDLVS